MTFLLWKNDVQFPPLLLQTDDCPAQLFCLGKALNPNDTYFAIVGTRRPSQYGKQMVEEFSRSLTQAGFVIVSGLAYGIDGIAHQACLDAGGRTIAVLGAGLNHITPPCNRPLAKEIQKTGTIITEFPADLRPNKTTFPQRNRIIAGMSLATLIIEAPERSGALITARYSLDYNRDTFALPGNITQESSRGSNKLLRDAKAHAVSCVQDIFDTLQITRGFEAAHIPSTNGHLLSKEELCVYELLKISSCSIDEIAATLLLPISNVSVILSLLEIKGLVAVIGSHAFITR